MIFETEKLLVRKLVLSDVNEFHKMQSNPKVMQFVDGKVKTFDAHLKELIALIRKYHIPKNDFWIYAIERKLDKNFIGTLALVKDNNDDEIGYRFLEKYWNKGYATEICEGFISYCRQLGIPKLIAYAIDKNIASSKILKRFNFTPVKHFISDDMNLPETKYELIL